MIIINRPASTIANVVQFLRPHTPVLILLIFLLSALIFHLWITSDRGESVTVITSEHTKPAIDITSLDDCRKTRSIDVMENNNSRYKYTAMIIEPRNHPGLEFVLRNFAQNLDDDWQIIIFHGINNVNLSQTIADKYSIDDRIKLVNLNVTDLGKREYDTLMLSRTIYSFIPTEIFLVFQVDALVNPNGRHLLAQFLDYDYVGAPWDRKYPSGVGNGGLSLRRKSKMLEILEKCPQWKPSNYGEDVHFSYACDQVKLCKPSVDLATHFAVQVIYSTPYWGVHDVWKYLPITHRGQYDKLVKEFPDVETLRNISGWKHPWPFQNVLS